MFAAALSLAAALAVPPAAVIEVDKPIVAADPDTLAGPGEGGADDIVAGATDRHSRMTVPVTIDGQGPFRFLIDTGAQATVVARHLRDRLNLRTLGTATVVGMASRQEVELVQLDGLEFAARVFDALHSPLLEGEHIGADGILGVDSLQNLRVLIDFRADTIAVNDARALGGNAGYEIVVRARSKLGRLIITNADIDGVRAAVIIDTGAQGSVGNRTLQKRLRAREGVPITSTDVTGTTITGSLSLARSVTIGSGTGRQMRLNSLPIAYSDAPAFAALGLAGKPALVLGIEDLRLFDRVAIDFAQRTVLFDLPAGSFRASS